MKNLILTLALAVLPLAAQAATLEEEIKGLDVEEQVPAAISKEKYYSIQSRNVSLKNRLEILASVAENFTGNGFMSSEQVGGEVQYHLNDDWSAAVGYNQVFNRFKESAERLLEVEGLLPDVDYAKSRIEGRIQYNLFYGKFRFTKDSVMYFDQYVSVGYASHTLGSGPAGGPVFDAGFAFWVSDWGSLHLGVKDYYYPETGRLTTGTHHNVHGYVQAGYLL